MVSSLIKPRHEYTVIDCSQHAARRPPNYAGLSIIIGCGLILYAYRVVLLALFLAGSQIFVGLVQLWIGLAALTYILFRRLPPMPIRVFVQFLWFIVAQGLSLVGACLWPKGEVTTWHYKLYDNDSGQVLSAILFDGTGVPPEARAHVIIRGHRHRHYFKATRILRIGDTDGTLAERPHGLVARQIPPTWMAVTLLVAGLLLNLLG